MSLEKNDFKYGFDYYGDCSELAQGIMQYMYNYCDDLKNSYLNLGRNLCEFKRMEYYKEFGYDNFFDCIFDNLGLEKGTISKCMNVYDRFGRKQSKDNYLDYSYSQLVEMLPVPEKDIKKFTPDMSVTKMREKKKQLKENFVKVATSQPDIQQEEFSIIKYYSLHGAARTNYAKKYINSQNSKILESVKIFNLDGEVLFDGMVYKSDFKNENIYYI